MKIVSIWEKKAGKVKQDNESNFIEIEKNDLHNFLGGEKKWHQSLWQNVFHVCVFHKGREIEIDLYFNAHIHKDMTRTEGI